jgi:hypothetical protein
MDELVDKIEVSNGMFPGSDGLNVFLVVGVTIVHLRVPSRMVGAVDILRFIDMIDGEIASCPLTFLHRLMVLCIDVLPNPTVNH